MLTKRKLILLILTNIFLLKLLNAKEFIINLERQKAKDFFIKDLTKNILMDIWKGQAKLNEICSALHGRDKIPTIGEIGRFCYKNFSDSESDPCANRIFCLSGP